MFLHQATATDLLPGHGALFDPALYNVLGNKGFTHTHLPPPISHFKFLPYRKKRIREKTSGLGEKKEQIEELTYKRDTKNKGKKEV